MTTTMQTDPQLVDVDDITVGTRLQYLGGTIVVDEIHTEPGGYRWFTDVRGQEFGLGMPGQGGFYFLAGEQS